MPDAAVPFPELFTEPAGLPVPPGGPVPFAAADLVTGTPGPTNTCCCRPTSVCGCPGPMCWCRGVGGQTTGYSDVRIVLAGLPTDTVGGSTYTPNGTYRGVQQGDYAVPPGSNLFGHWVAGLAPYDVGDPPPSQSPPPPAPPTACSGSDPRVRVIGTPAWRWNWGFGAVANFLLRGLCGLYEGTTANPIAITAILPGGPAIPSPASPYFGVVGAYQFQLFRSSGLVLRYRSAGNFYACEYTTFEVDTRVIQFVGWTPAIGGSANDLVGKWKMTRQSGTWTYPASQPYFPPVVTWGEWSGSVSPICDGPAPTPGGGTGLPVYGPDTGGEDTTPGGDGGPDTIPGGDGGGGFAPLAARVALPDARCRFRSDDPHTVRDGTGRLAFTCRKPDFDRGDGRDVFECDSCGTPPDARCGSLARCPGYVAADPEE